MPDIEINNQRWPCYFVVGNRISVLFPKTTEEAARVPRRGSARVPRSERGTRAEPRRGNFTHLSVPRDDLFQHVLVFDLKQIDSNNAPSLGVKSKYLKMQLGLIS